MKYRVLIRAFTARRDVTCMMVLEKYLLQSDCVVKISSQREFLMFTKLWKPHLIVLNTVGLSEKIKKLSNKSAIVYIPGEGSEVGNKSDAYFWKNNPAHLKSLDLALLWGNFPQAFKNIVSNIRKVLDKTPKDNKASESKDKIDSNQ